MTDWKREVQLQKQINDLRAEKRKQTDRLAWVLLAIIFGVLPVSVVLIDEPDIHRPETLIVLPVAARLVYLFEKWIDRT